MSATVATTATDTCPAWCSTHVPPVDATDTAMHFASDRFGDTLAEGWRIGVAQEDSRPATVDAEAGGQMTTAQARARAARSSMPPTKPRGGLTRPIDGSKPPPASFEAGGGSTPVAGP